MSHAISAACPSWNQGKRLCVVADELLSETYQHESHSDAGLVPHKVHGEPDMYESGGDNGKSKRKLWLHIMDIDDVVDDDKSDDEEWCEFQ